jgi:aldehyde:ferredoxin oxidoreductase
MNIGRRVVNVMRIYNLKCGLTPDKEKPSSRYCSYTVDGPNVDKPIVPHWEKMMDQYYQMMGWDRKTGMPLPEILKKLGIEDLTK